jgi:hypothetical protein
MLAIPLQVGLGIIGSYQRGNNYARTSAYPHPVCLGMVGLFSEVYIQRRLYSIYDMVCARLGYR